MLVVSICGIGFHWITVLKKDTKPNTKDNDINAGNSSIVSRFFLSGKPSRSIVAVMGIISSTQEYSRLPKSDSSISDVFIGDNSIEAMISASPTIPAKRNRLQQISNSNLIPMKKCLEVYFSVGSNYLFISCVPPIDHR